MFQNELYESHKYSNIGLNVSKESKFCLKLLIIVNYT